MGSEHYANAEDLQARPGTSAQQLLPTLTSQILDFRPLRALLAFCDCNGSERQVGDPCRVRGNHLHSCRTKAATRSVSAEA